MNDFTKKELLEIYGLLEHHYCDPEKCINPNQKLLVKIQSMIENYPRHECNHQTQSETHENRLGKTVCCGMELTFVNTTWATPKCHKCGRVLNDNQ